MLIRNFIQKFSITEPGPTYKKVINNTSWLLFDRLLRMAIGIYITIWVAKYLGPEQFGLLNFAFALTAILGLLSTLGLDQIIIRDLVKAPEISDKTLGTALILKLIGSILTVLFSVLIVSLIRPGEHLTIFIVGIIATGTIFQSSDIIDLFFKSETNSKFPVISKSIPFIIINVVKILMILNNAPLIAFAWAALVELILSAIGLFVAYKIRGFRVKEWSFSFNRAKELLLESWPLFLSGISILIYMKIDQIMLAQISGDISVGFYSAALKLSEVWYAIPLAIMNSATPIITKSYSININQYHLRLQKLFNLMTLIGLVLAIPTTFLAPLIIKVVYGKEYIISASILSIHIWTSIFVGWGLLKDMILVTQNLTKIILITTVVGALSNVLINLILIPPFMGVGAAYATLISQIISVSIILLLFNKTRRFTKMQMKSIFRFYDIVPK